VRLGHDCANSDMTNAMQAFFSEISASTGSKLERANALCYNGPDSRPASIMAKADVPQGDHKHHFNFEVDTLALGRQSGAVG